LGGARTPKEYLPKGGLVKKIGLNSFGILGLTTFIPLLLGNPSTIFLQIVAIAKH
jgi:hypothetical protein